jgi:peptide/nickel transport system ATP-binding protein
VREFRQRSTAALRPTVLRAVDRVSLELNAGATLGVVGESGSGKSTLGRMLAGILEPSAGELRFEGELLCGAARDRPPFRRAVQLVFQDPLAALNPRHRVRESLLEPRRSSVQETKAASLEHVERALASVGLPPDMADRFPHQLSGGQAQRVGIARALVVEPRLLILDEALASLDLATQQEIIDLLRRLRGDLGLGYLFIAHDLPLVAELCERAIVMYQGRVVEAAASRALLSAPEHPDTRALVAAVPRLG